MKAPLLILPPLLSPWVKGGGMDYRIHYQCSPCAAAGSSMQELVVPAIVAL